MNITPIYKRENISLYQGDLNEVLPELMKLGLIDSVNAVITSPPYAMQRSKDYSSISEDSYPEFTDSYFDLLKPLLKDNGSILLVARPHIKSGQISDYLLRTRLLLRKKWTECEELIWFKTNSPPLGSTKRPRRAWESILWFGKSGDVYCDTKSEMKKSSRIGFSTSKYMEGDSFVNEGQKIAGEGISRDIDVVQVGVNKNESKLTHPAMFPEQLSTRLIKMVSKEGDLILDPFSGSGTTGVSCLKTKRQFIGIDIDENYLQESVLRFEREFDRLAFNKTHSVKRETSKSPTVNNNTIISF